MWSGSRPTRWISTPIRVWDRGLSITQPTNPCDRAENQPSRVSRLQPSPQRVPASQRSAPPAGAKRNRHNHRPAPLSQQAANEKQDSKRTQRQNCHLNLNHH